MPFALPSASLALRGLGMLCLVVLAAGAATGADAIERRLPPKAPPIADLVAKLDDAQRLAWERVPERLEAVQQRIALARFPDDGQRADWRREVELRRRHQWQNVVDAGMSQFDTALGLTTAQHEAVEKLLMDKPLRVNDAKVRLHGGHFAPFICKYALSKLDQQQLKTLVTDRQWKTLGTFVEQGRAIAAHLKQQKMIVEEGPAGAGDR